MTLWRLAISAFVAILLVVVGLGWIWTSRNQPAALATASHVVLGIAALAGLFALFVIWRPNPQRIGRHA